MELNEIINSILRYKGATFKVEKLKLGVENDVFKITFNSKEIPPIVLKISCQQRFDEAQDIYKLQKEALKTLSDSGLPVNNILFEKIYKDERKAIEIYKFSEGIPLIPTDTSQLSKVVLALKQIQDVNISCIPVKAKKQDYILQINSFSVNNKIKKKLVDEYKNISLKFFDVTLCHGDFQPGNIIWFNGKINSIIDWDNICLARPEVDIAHYYSDLKILSNDYMAEEFLRMAIRLPRIDKEVLLFFIHFDAAYTYSNYYKWESGFWGENRTKTNTETDMTLLKILSSSFNEICNFNEIL